MLTDGGQNERRYNVDQLIDRLVRSNVRVFVYLIQNTPAKTEEEARDLDFMASLAEQTGGDSGIFPSERWKSRGDLIKLALYQQAQMANYYVLDLVLPEPLSKRTGWKLELAHGNNPRSGRLKLSYPRHLPPCAVAASPQ